MKTKENSKLKIYRSFTVRTRQPQN